MSNIFYAGIGSRQTPPTVLKQMTQWAVVLRNSRLKLRSGGAAGADSAFYEGAGADSEIFVPWPGYNGFSYGHIGNNFQRALDIAQEHHPAWHRCTEGARKLHARNVHIILGRNLDAPVRFVICYTPGGLGTGGTGLGIRLAKAYNVPVYDVGYNSLTPTTLQQKIELLLKRKLDGDFL